MKREYPPVYRESRAQARRLGETKAFRESLQLNVSCAKAIEQAIRDHADEDDPKGFLFDGCARSVLDEYGFQRTQFVLANTLIATGSLDFEPDSLRWARMVLIPPDKDNQKFRVQADRPLLAQFVQQTYAEYQAQGLFGPEQCGAPGQNFAGKVVVLRPDRLAESCLSPQNLLWLAECGFGCDPNSSGRAVFATCLGDGEKTRWNRLDFMGVLDEQYLPDWAQEKLTELRAPAQQQEEPVQEQGSDPAQGGMEMR